MKINYHYKGEAFAVEAEPEAITQTLDELIRSNPQVWDIVRRVAGNYQAELVKSQLKKAHILMPKDKRHS